MIGEKGLLRGVFFALPISILIWVSIFGWIKLLF